MAAVKFSRQRESIKANLMRRMDHPTADMVYEEVRREFPNISLGTVYRNLALLTELGEIRKLPMEDGPDRFDGNVHPHDHFTCRICRRIIDLPRTDAAETLRQRAADGFDGRIEGETIQFYGLCPDCTCEKYAPFFRAADNKLKKRRDSK